MSIPTAIALMNQQDALAAAAVAAESANIANAINLVVTAFKNTGRLLYIGAGTSGRLGVLDASECPPTFRTDPQMVQGIIAGGDAAMFKAQEGAEDDAKAGAAAVDEKSIGPNDVVMGIAAGGTTPFVHGALRRAIELKAKTIFLSCVQPVPNEPPVDVVIRPLTGPEVLTGSTRLKAGTATKLVLNQITTIAMVQLGKCYENLMVDLKASNAKLKDRAARIVTVLTGLDLPAAGDLLDRANGHVKIAVVMHHHQVDATAARKILDRHDGQLRAAIQK
jgi:N-acetylmuramic acid 6-phosphate etherase